VTPTVAIIGAGAGGIAMGVRLGEAGDVELRWRHGLRTIFPSRTRRSLPGTAGSNSLVPPMNPAHKGAPSCAQ
jgi:thioredoxin reductase